MPQESKEKLRSFEQRLREEGSDGFADGPRPWEHWDESGHQANNRIWEGSARRLHPGRRKARSLGYRLLSVLAFLALTTLLVGIAGVYYSHTQTQQLAQREVQPLPATPPPVPSTTSAADETVITAAALQPHDLNVLSAPAAGSGSTQEQALAAIETVPAVDAAILATDVPDEPAPVTGIIEREAMAPETIPPATSDSIDSVSIETIVTEKSVTTTVYTRHPQQQESEIVAAIETTPPPFAHGVVDAPLQAPDAEPPGVHISDAGTMTTAPSTMPPPALPAEEPAAAADAPVAASADEEPLDALADDPATAASEEQSAAALAEPANDTATVALVDTTAGDTAMQPETAAAVTPAVHTGDTAAVAATEPSSAIVIPEPLVDTVPEVTAEQGDAPLDNQPMEQAEETTAVTVTGADSATNVPEVSAEPSNETVAAVTPVVTPVAKTGDWVINLASYTWKSMASRKLALFQQQGVDAEIFAVTINDKPMYRIRVTGFENSREAKARIPAIEEALDLKGAWISRR